MRWPRLEIADEHPRSEKFFPLAKNNNIIFYFPQLRLSHAPHLSAKGFAILTQVNFLPMTIYRF